MKERDFQMYLNFEQHRVMDRFFSLMEPEIMESLDGSQKRDISRALVRSFLSPSRKLVDLRWNFSLFGRRYFLMFLLGPDSREGEPRYFGRYLSRSRWPANLLFLSMSLVVLLCTVVGAKQIIEWIF